MERPSITWVAVVESTSDATVCESTAAGVVGVAGVENENGNGGSGGSDGNQKFHWSIPSWTNELNVSTPTLVSPCPKVTLPSSQSAVLKVTLRAMRSPKL